MNNRVAFSVTDEAGGCPMTPNFTGRGAGKAFEKVCLEYSGVIEKKKLGTFSRYGVQASMIEGEWRPIASLPDFDGILAPDGKQFIFDAKVCSAASFPLAKYTDRRSNQRRQLNHMLKRDRFGAVCFFLIHFNHRALKTKTDDAETWAVPVYVEHPLWERFRKREQMSLSRADCREHGAEVMWDTFGRSQKTKPCIVEAVAALKELRQQHREELAEYAPWEEDDEIWNAAQERRENREIADLF